MPAWWGGRPMRAVAYIRVSDLSQVEGYSLDAQERLFLQHCKVKGWTPLQVYREEGRSAHSDSIRKRPVFRQLLEDASQGQFDVLVLHTLDRWARNQRVCWSLCPSWPNIKWPW